MNISKIIIYTCAAAAGGGLGYLIGGIVVDFFDLKKEYVEEESYEDEGYAGNDDEEEEDDDEEESKEFEELSSQIKNMPKNDSVKVVANYAEMYKEGKLMVPGIEITTIAGGGGGLATGKEVVRSDKPLVFLITHEDFIDNPENYDKTSLTYYMEDNVVADAMEKIFTDRLRVEHTMHKEMKDCFGTESDDPDTFYFCDEDLGLMYEVVQVPESYDKMVLGIDDLQTKKQARKKHAKDEVIRPEKEEYPERYSGRRKRKNESIED